MAQVFKNPLAQSEAISKTPTFNKAALVAYLKNYGSGFTDDAYEEWAKKKGKQLQGKPLNPEFLKTDFAKQWYGDRTETYADQYLNDDEWLQEMWPDVAEDALEYNQAFAIQDQSGRTYSSLSEAQEHSKMLEQKTKDYIEKNHPEAIGDEKYFARIYHQFEKEPQNSQPTNDFKEGK